MVTVEPSALVTVTVPSSALVAVVGFTITFVRTSPDTKVAEPSAAGVILSFGTVTVTPLVPVISYPVSVSTAVAVIVFNIAAKSTRNTLLSAIVNVITVPFTVTSWRYLSWIAVEVHVFVPSLKSKQILPSFITMLSTSLKHNAPSSAN